MDKVNAIVLVGGKGSRLKGLTKNKSKSFVSFMGKYRIIDFTLSSLSNSHIYDVGILTQYEPYELMKYIGSGSSWDLDVFNRGVSFLTPYEVQDNSLLFQKGTANAVLSQIEYIKKSTDDYILILPGDQIYRIDFSEVLKFHKEKGAKLTIISTDLDPSVEDLTRFGIIEYNEENRITGFMEKPAFPKSNHVSLGIYLFNKEFLLKYLPQAKEMIDFGKNLIPYIISHSNQVYAYNFNGTFMDVGTIKSLYDANMYFIDHPHDLSHSGENTKVYTKPLDYPPHYIHMGATVSRSVISDAADINGSIIHSLISFKVKVERGAKVVDSIILPGATIKEGAKLKCCIVDEDLIINKKSNYQFETPTLIDEAFLKEHENG